MPASVTNVQKLGTQGNSIGLSASQTKLRSYYLVTLSGPDPLGSNIANFASFGGTTIPTIGSSLNGSSYTVVEVSSDPAHGDASGVNWIVTVEYGLNAYAFQSGTGITAPWQRADRVGFHDKQYERVVTADFNSDASKNGGNPRPYVNRAQQPFANPQMRRFTNPLLIVHRARLASSYDPFAASACIDSLNSAGFVIQRANGANVTVPPEQAVLRSAVAEDTIWTQTGQLYEEITLEIEVQGQIPLKFIYIQDKGFYCLFTNALGAEALAHCVNKSQDPDWTGTPTAGHPTPYLTTNDDGIHPIYTPVNNEVFLATIGGKPGHRLGDALAPTAANGYSDLEFTHYPTKSWSGFII